MSFHSIGIEISEEARDDLADISAYGFDVWGEAESFRYFSELVATLERIERFPMLGTRWADEDAHIRRLRHDSHVIYYEVDDEGKAARVLRVLHGRMDAAQHLDPS